jgi:DNA (cytosine-5)-methyltransferase 1
MLRTHKIFSNKQIAEKLNVPITNVEHWFRRDEYFSIPDADIWFQLKELLGITTDEFDAPITEFEEREGVFEQSNRVYHEDGVSPTIMAETNNGIRIATNNKQGYQEVSEGDFINLQYASSSTRRGRIGEQIAQTICCTDEQGVAVEAPFAYDEQNGYARSDGTVGTLTTNGSSLKHNNRVIVPNDEKTEKKDNLRIRKLTPLECWRLMDFDDEDFHKAEAIESNTQLYAQAGNSIVVNCLVAIFGQMFEGKEHIYEKLHRT